MTFDDGGCREVANRENAARSQSWIAYLFARCARHRGPLLAAVVGAAGTAATTAAIPLIVRGIVDDIAEDSSVSVTGALELLIAIAVLRFVFAFSRRYYSSVLSLGVQHDLRSSAFATLLRSGSAETETLGTGQIVSRMITDITFVQMFLQIVPMVFASGILVIAAIILMAVISLPLTAIAAAILPILWVITWRSQRQLFPANWDAQNQAAITAMRVEAAIGGVRVVKGFGMELAELDKLETAAQDLYRSRLRVVRLSSRFTPALLVVTLLGQTGVLLVGGLLAINDLVTIGTFLAAMTYLGLFATPIRQFSMFLTVSQQGRASTERIRELIGPDRGVGATEPETGSRATGSIRHPPSIELDNIVVERGGSRVVDGVCLRIASGETVAITGPSGSGKSTLASVLPRLVEPNTGTVRLGGINTQELSLRALREQIAFVFEEPHLIDGSIRENVSYGRPDTTDEEVWEALRIAVADDFVRALPTGLDAQIGEGGQRLSGGQRQRVALARALLLDAPVLVLDDATSAIDPRIEEEILRRIRSRIGGATTIIIGHRPSTLALADRVVVLTEGVLTATDEPRARREVALPGDPWDRSAATEGLDDGLSGQLAQAAARRAASGGVITSTDGGAMLTAEASKEMLERLQAIPPAIGDPEVPKTFTHTADRKFTLGRLLRPFRWPLSVGLGLVLVDALAQLSIPYLTKLGIDKGVLDGSVTMLLLAVAIASVVVLVDWWVVTTQLRVSGRAGERLLYGLRVKAFAHLQRLDLQFYEHELGGRIMTRMTTDIDGLAAFIQTGMSTALTSILSMTGVLIVVLGIDAKLALILLAAMPLLAGGTWLFRTRAVPAYQRARESVSSVNAYLQENVETIQVTQAFRREAVNQAKFEHLSWDYRNARLRSQVTMAIFFPAVEFLSVITTALVLIVGLREVRADAVTIGTLIAFVLYIDQFFSPVQLLAQVFDSYQQAVIGVRRIGELLRIKSATPEADEPVPAHRLSGEIEFRNVSFTYRSSAAAVLNEVDVHIPPGQEVAVVGATGAGKSTLAKLIARYYDPTGGTVRVDGVDIAAYELGEYRRALGIVPQEPTLMGDTVQEVIAYGRPEADRDQIEWAAREVGAHEMICRLSGGYHHRIGHRGTALSAGQRQLLALARARLVDPHILILDEATASLDVVTEKQVQAAIRTISAGRTTIVIAHRLTTAATADRILVIADGQIVEDGQHDELLAKGGHYREMWKAFADADQHSR